MLSIIRYALVGWVVLAAAGTAQAKPFAGTLEATSWSRGVASDLKVRVLPGHGVRVERSALRLEEASGDDAAAVQMLESAPDTVRGPTVMLLKADEPDRFYKLSDADQSYQIIPFPRSRDMVPGQLFELTKKASEPVAGIPCQHAVISSSDGQEYEVWLTGSLLSLDELPEGVQRVTSLPGGFSDLLIEAGMNGFVLQMSYRQQGAERARYTTTRVVREVPDKGLFSVPPGYAERQPQPRADLDDQARSQVFRRLGGVEPGSDEHRLLLQALRERYRAHGG